MTKVIRRQTSPFDCGTPLFFHISLLQFIHKAVHAKKIRIAVHTKNKKKIKVDEIIHKFTRRQVSSELNYTKMYNIYIHCVRSPSKQQLNQKIVFSICLFFNIVIMCLSFEARN